MFAINFTDTSFEKNDPKDHYDLLLGVEATVSVAIGSLIVVSEPSFPIVELRTALKTWLAAESTNDFEFESMETDERGLVWFRRQPSGRWCVGSVWQDRVTSDAVSLSDLSAGCRAFIAAVDAWVRDNLHEEVDDVLQS